MAMTVKPSHSARISQAGYILTVLHVKKPILPTDTTPVTVELVLIVIIVQST